MFATGIKFDVGFRTQQMAKPLPTDPFWSAETGAHQPTTVSHRFVFPSYNVYITRENVSHGHVREDDNVRVGDGKKDEKSHEIIVIAPFVAQPVCYPYAVFHGIRYNYETNI